LPKAQVRTSAGHAILTDDFGRYRVDGAPVGELLVRAAKDGWGGGGTVVVKKGETLTYDITLTQLPPRGFIGLKLDVKDGVVIVSGVTPKSPAEGVVQLGDVVVRVAGEEVGGEADRARKLAAGPPGEVLKLTVRRGEQTLDLSLTRATIEVSR
jgi:S1-C subfamily serine protease